jgi:folate-binding protein YgfZ
MGVDDNRGMDTLNNPSQFEHLSVIRATGADAASFLQGQLSNDFVLLKPNQWQLAAYCSPKGRMLASFWGIKLTNSPATQDICLVLSKDIAAATLKRLSMFVMRAKLTLTEADDMLPELFANHGLAAWSEREVARGIARITAPLVDLFVPQMLNYESIGGVSFKKGCYPGQEIVARSQFRGAIKRRTYLVDVSLALSDKDSQPSIAVGQEVYGLQDDGSLGDASVGVVVQTDGDQALICIQTSSASSDLRVGSKNGAAVKILDLPYQLLEDI